MIAVVKLDSWPHCLPTCNLNVGSDQNHPRTEMEYKF